MAYKKSFQQKTPNQCLCHEKWPVWGYASVEVAQSSLLMYMHNFVLNDGGGGGGGGGGKLNYYVLS